MGRDQYKVLKEEANLKFQPTRPHGARLRLIVLIILLMLFQPTRPHGARRPTATCNNGTKRFNPRARMGRDPDIGLPDIDPEVSTHAPAWGATCQVW